MSIASDRAIGLLQYLSIDPESDRLLFGMVAGLLTPMENLSLIAHGDGDTIGPWEAITNPAKAPMWALPCAAQWTGGIMPVQLPGEPDDQYLTRAQAAVTHPNGMLRGSARAMEIVAMAYLTGTQHVNVLQQLGGSVWENGIEVYETEVTDLAALTAAVNDPAVILAGMRCTVSYATPGQWTVADMESQYFGQTVADLEAAYGTVADLEADTPTGGS